jgi:hypothetical protein
MLQCTGIDGICAVLSDDVSDDVQQQRRHFLTVFDAKPHD